MSLFNRHSFHGAVAGLTLLVAPSKLNAAELTNRTDRADGSDVKELVLSAPTLRKNTVDVLRETKVAIENALASGDQRSISNVLKQQQRILRKEADSLRKTIDPKLIASSVPKLREDRSLIFQDNTPQDVISFHTVNVLEARIRGCDRGENAIPDIKSRVQPILNSTELAGLLTASR